MNSQIKLAIVMERHLRPACLKNQSSLMDCPKFFQTIFQLKNGSAFVLVAPRRAAHQAAFTSAAEKIRDQFLTAACDQFRKNGT